MLQYEITNRTFVSYLIIFPFIFIQMHETGNTSSSEEVLLLLHSNGDHVLYVYLRPEAAVR